MNTVESFLTFEEEQMIVHAIQLAEKNTSGEIRVHIEKKPNKNLNDRAIEVFNMLGMQNTIQRNGVLLYVATDSKQFVILGDEGIDQKVPKNFWEFEKNLITHYFKQNKNCKALTDAIAYIGENLKTYFPYQSDDVNELSNEISKG